MTDGKPEFGTPGEEKEEQSRLFADFAEGYARRWSVTPDNFAYDPDAHLLALLFPLSDGNEARRTYYQYEGEEGNPPQLKLLVHLKQESAGGQYSFRQYSFIPEDAEQGLQKIEYDPKKYFGVHISLGVPVGDNREFPVELDYSYNREYMPVTKVLGEILYPPLADITSVRMDEVEALKELLQSGSIEKSGVWFSFLEGEGPEVEREDGKVRLDQVRVVKKDPSDPGKEKIVFDITFPIGMTSEDVRNIMEDLIGKEVLKDPVRAPAGADKNLRRTNVLAALGIKIQTPGIETDSSKAFRQALRKTTESSEPAL